MKKDNSTLISYVNPDKIKKAEQEMTEFLSGKPLDKIGNGILDKTKIAIDKPKIQKMALPFLKERRKFLQERFMLKAWGLVDSIIDNLEHRIKEDSKFLTAKSAASLLDALLNRLVEAEENAKEAQNFLEDTKKLHLSDEMLGKLIDAAKKMKEKEPESKKVIDI